MTTVGDVTSRVDDSLTTGAVVLAVVALWQFTWTNLFVTELVQIYHLPREAGGGAQTMYPEYF